MVEATIADALIVPASIDGDVRWFVVERGTAGLDVVPQARIDGRGVGIVRFTGCELGEDAALVGADLEPAVNAGLVALSWELLGIAGQAFDDTLAYLKTREQFGQPIGAFQALQHRAARLFIELTLARSAAMAAASAIDDDAPDVSRLASLAKAQCGDTCELVTAEAIQMHGGIGMTDEHTIGLYFKRARAAAATLGDGVAQRDRWARLGGY